VESEAVVVIECRLASLTRCMKWFIRSEALFGRVLFYYVGWLLPVTKTSIQSVLQKGSVTAGSTFEDNVPTETTFTVNSAYCMSAQSEMIFMYTAQKN
jgi:hypothetical protein